VSAELKMLEKLFAAEVSGTLPFQTRAAMIKRLHAHGLVQPMKTTIPADKGCPFPVTIKGWQLTHAGRLMYCASCRKEGRE